MSARLIDETCCEPFDVLHDLHTRYPEAGQALSRDQLDQLDSEVRDWQCRIEELEARATRLADREGDGVGAARLRVEAASARDNLPRTFEHAMNRSQMFFHPDKRKKDLATSSEEKSTQFAQVKEAWSQLVAYRSRFEAVRVYRAKMAAM